MLGHPDTTITPFSLDSGIKITHTEAGFMELNLPGFSYPLRLILTPYANEVTFKKFLGKNHPQDQLRQLLSSQWGRLAAKYCDNSGVNIMMAHLYFMSRNIPAPEESDDEKSILFHAVAQPIYT